MIISLYVALEPEILTNNDEDDRMQLCTSHVEAEVDERRETIVHT